MDNITDITQEETNANIRIQIRRTIKQIQISKSSLALQIEQLQKNLANQTTIDAFGDEFKVVKTAADELVK